MALRSTLSRALERGTQFLVARQGGDGLWRDFRTSAGEASHWPTGFVGAVLHRARVVEDSVLERAASALSAAQHADGGWSYNESVPSDADSTACALLFLSRWGQRANERDCERAAACLRLHQHGQSGGIATFADPGPIRRFMGIGWWMRFGGWCQPHIEVTAMAGRAWNASLPDKGSAELQSAWRFVRALQCPDGSWNSYWWTSCHYATSQAVELALLMGDGNAVQRAGEWAIRAQSADGSWGSSGAPISAFATALCVSILVHANSNLAAIERAVARLAALQDADGGWPAHPIMRIPLPSDRDPDRPRRRWLVRLGRGIVVQDQHRSFTTAVCIAALARYRDMGRMPTQD